MYTLQCVYYPFPMTDCTGGFMSNPNSTYYIPDSSIKASSEYASYHPASYGRLYGSERWLSAVADSHPWIQADLGRMVNNVSGIQTQGDKFSWWVITLKVSTFQNVSGSGDGDFIQDENEVKVCIKRKQ